MHASARGLVKIASLMANGGKLHGKQVLKKETWDELHSEPTVHYEALLAKHTIYTKGGTHYYNSKLIESSLNYVEKNSFSLREGFYGWQGIGGAIMQWNPELKIAFAYVPRDMSLIDPGFYRAG